MNRSRMLVPPRPKIYHILHVDRIASIASDGFLWSDAQMTQRHSTGTTIGMSNIKQRRQKELYLTCHPGLHVGDCVPFYFGPRSVMLFLIHKRNPDLTYGGGQELVVHLEADLRRAVEWAQQRRLRWAFALSNAGPITSNQDRTSQPCPKSIGTRFTRGHGRGPAYPHL